MTRALLRLALVGLCAVALSGCISLLPKSKPAQLYRFGPVATGAITRSDRKVRAVDSRGLYSNARPASSVISLHLENAMTRAFCSSVG